jgi:hypothetical protein
MNFSSHLPKSVRLEPLPANHLFFNLALRYREGGDWQHIPRTYVAADCQQAVQAANVAEIVLAPTSGNPSLARATAALAGQIPLHVVLGFRKQDGTFVDCMPATVQRYARRQLLVFCVASSAAVMVLSLDHPWIGSSLALLAMYAFQSWRQIPRGYLD